jgi:hypothetical protein
LFGYHTEIESRLPLLRVKGGGTALTNAYSLPWEPKGHLIEGRTNAAPDEQ